MRNVGIILRRELASYFATPLAYVFILIFLVLANAFTFYLAASTSAARRTSSPSSPSIRGSISFSFRRSP